MSEQPSLRLLLLTMLTMVAFAGNSVLNRLAVGSDTIAPMDFALIRLGAGAATLALLLLATGNFRWTGWHGKTTPIVSLLTYLIGFSLAYRALDAGSGALILFGVVQITMFAGAVATKERLPRNRWLGAGLAFSGLMVLLWPAANTSIDLSASLWMVMAGIGWGLYSLVGTNKGDPLLATGWNFLLALGPGALIMVWFLDISSATWQGIAYAVTSGALTSALGYALWYSILPSLGSARAAIAQLSVPLIAALAGMALLSEPVGLRTLIAALFVCVGVVLGIRSQQEF